MSSIDCKQHAEQDKQKTINLVIAIVNPASGHLKSFQFVDHYNLGSEGVVLHHAKKEGRWAYLRAICVKRNAVVLYS
jgi:hypothetical protein